MALSKLSELKSLKNTYTDNIRGKGILYLEGEFIEGTFISNKYGNSNVRTINNACFIRNFDRTLIEKALLDNNSAWHGRYNVKILLNIKNSFPKNSSLSFPDNCFYLFFQDYVTDYYLGETLRYNISLKVNLKGTHVDCLTAGTYLLVADDIGGLSNIYNEESGYVLGHSFDYAEFELVCPKPNVWFGTLDRYNSLTTKYDDVLYLFESY